MTEPDIEIRLVKLEQKLDNLTEKVSEMSASNKSYSEMFVKCIKDIGVNATSIKSAHHRLDDMWKFVFWATGIAATLVGVFASIFTAYLSR
jgi:hypothetical protein